MSYEAGLLITLVRAVCLRRKPDRWRGTLVRGNGVMHRTITPYHVIQAPFRGALSQAAPTVPAVVRLWRFGTR